MLHDMEWQGSNQHSVLDALHPMSRMERSKRLRFAEGLKDLAHPFSTPTDVAQKLVLGEHAIWECVRVLVEWLWWFPLPEPAGEVVVEAGQGVIRQEPRSRSVQPPVWLWARGCLSRPQVGLPKFLGAIEDRGLHEPQRRREIVFQTPDKWGRHRIRSSALNGQGRVVPRSPSQPGQNPLAISSALSSFPGSPSGYRMAIVRWGGVGLALPSRGPQFGWAEAVLLTMLYL